MSSSSSPAPFHLGAGIRCGGVLVRCGASWCASSRWLRLGPGLVCADSSRCTDSVRTFDGEMAHC